jgi:hypothetical protein
MALKNFIIQEALRSEHAERYILFQERYHTQVLLDLKKALEKEWTRDINSLSKIHPIADDHLEFALLNNPKATGKLSVETKDEKLVSSSHREAVEVSPSAKVPLLYKREEREIMIRQLLDGAEAAIKHVTDAWSEIFRIEKKGRATPWFKILRDHDEIRFQLGLSDGGRDMYKTLYTVKVEYGKQGSKLKDFDRVYLFSRI